MMLRPLRALALSQGDGAPLEEEEEDGDDGGRAEQAPLGGAQGWDEEDERRLWVAVLQQAALQALGQREMLREELELLQQHACQQQQAQLGGRGDARVAAARAAEQQQEQQAQVRGGTYDRGWARRQPCLSLSPSRGQAATRARWFLCLLAPCRCWASCARLRSTWATPRGSSSRHRCVSGTGAPWGPLLRRGSSSACGTRLT